MVIIEKRYEFVTTQIRYHNEKMIEAFNLFLKLFSAIIGGSIWLSLQPRVTPAKAATYANISNVLVVFIGVLACIMVFENLRAWHGYRWAEHRLGGLNDAGLPNIPPPRPVRASVTEGLMMAAMLGASILFCLFNPFTL